MDATTEAYSRRAAEYSDLLGSMAAVHPSDRQLIDSWTETLTGCVLDAGCGPGHWTDYLANRGLTAHGIDLVPAFVNRARTSYPEVRFDVGSIDNLNEPDGSLGGVLSWFSTIHHDPVQISAPIGEFARVLRPGGRLVLGFFTGPTIERFEHAVTPAYTWPPIELERILEATGFDVIETHTRTERGHRPVGAIVSRRSPTLG